MARTILDRLNLAGTSLLSVLLPAICEVCGRPLTDGERHLCLSCLTELPRTGCHLHPEDNEIHHRLSDNHVLVDRAAAMFHYYRDTPPTRLILSAKYRSRPSILDRLGNIYAAELLPTGFFDGIDSIVPVPVHWTRRLTRGYNQSEYLARGISRATGIPVDTRMLRLPHRHSTQTRRGSAERAANVRGTFASGRSKASPSHILLVDDIITTGATMRDCLRVLAERRPPARLSVLAIGLAQLS